MPNPRRDIGLVVILSLTAFRPGGVEAQQGSASLATKGPPPVTNFVVDFDCAKLKITVKSVGNPGNVSGFTPKFRRFTRQCTPERSVAANEWCTQEVWRVTADYSWTSALEPGEVHQAKDIDSGEVACDCHCATVSERLCVIGKDVEKSGLLGTTGTYHTNYIVEFEATKAGAEWKRWTQAVRVDGPRSWYGYHFSQCFDAPDTSAFCRELGARGVTPPGCGP